MIYFPIQTLASMGITQVRVILSGRSIGDIVEFLSDGQGSLADTPLTDAGAASDPPAGTAAFYDDTLRSAVYDLYRVDFERYDHLESI